MPRFAESPRGLSSRADPFRGRKSRQHSWSHTPLDAVKDDSCSVHASPCGLDAAADPALHGSLPQRPPRA
eukprot:1051644-Pyramimonas_sp.AAC.1